MTSKKEFQKKAHDTLSRATTGKSDAGKAGHRPVKPTEEPYRDEQRTGDYAAPWDGKRRLSAPTKSLRVAFTEDEIGDRRIELEKRLSQTPHLRDQVSAASDALKAAKAKLTSHIAENEAFSAVTKQGWQYQDVECIEVHEQRPGGYNLAVTYRTDTCEEVSKREATAEELQESIPGA